MFASHYFWFQLAILGYFVSLTALGAQLFTFGSQNPWPRRGLLTLAVGAQTVSLVLRAIAAAHAPVANFFESMNLFIYCLGLVAGWQTWRARDFAAFLPLLVAVVAAGFTLKIPSQITEMYPALQSVWFEVHVGSAFFSYALFTLGAGGSVGYFLRRGGGEWSFLKHLPASAALDRLANSANAWGFFWFSFSMLTGGIWAFYAWGNYWIWTAKEIWSALLWFYYALYIHARFTPRWAGKRANALSLLGFFVMLFTFLGVNLLLRSSHSF